MELCGTRARLQTDTFFSDSDSPTPISPHQTISSQVSRRHSFDLFDFIKGSNYFPEPVIRHIFRQVCDAVHYMHTNGYVHRDIKDENIIIDLNYTTKLVDFGVADRIP